MVKLSLLCYLSVSCMCNAVPCVSIITSMYDGDQFIAGFLVDMIQQTIFDQCELIIINANSPGHEEDIIFEYMQTYANIVYKKLDHDPGLYAVWNMAISMAQGTYITNANIDDRLKFDCYEQHKKALDTHPEIDLVYSDFYVTRFSNETFLHNNHSHVRVMPEFSFQELRKQPLPNNHPMWRKSMHTKYGLFDESYKHAGDWEFWLRAAVHGAQFLKVPGVYGLYYYNPHGLSTNIHFMQVIQKEEWRLHGEYDFLLGN